MKILLSITRILLWLPSILWFGLTRKRKFQAVRNRLTETGLVPVGFDRRMSNNKGFILFLCDATDEATVDWVKYQKIKAHTRKFEDSLVQFFNYTLFGYAKRRWLWEFPRASFEYAQCLQAIEDLEQHRTWVVSMWWGL